MSAPRWILTTLASLLLLAVLCFAIMDATDDLGQFHDPAGRSLAVFYADRGGKVLLNDRYVPANFNALLLGPSSSVNWRPEVLTAGTSLKMYNESLEGGNATEEKLLADHALARGHFRVALLIVYPTMVATHSYGEAMNKTSWVEALGSLDAFLDTVFTAMSNRHIAFPKDDAYPDGAHGLHYRGGIAAHEVAATHVDPQGVANMRQLAEELEHRGVKVIYVVPPLYEDTRLRSEPAISNFASSMQQQMPPGAWITFNGPQDTGFRTDRQNFLDNYHLSVKGAVVMSHLLHDRLCQLPESQYTKCQ